MSEESELPGMSRSIRQLVESKAFQRLIVAVIVLAGGVAGVETNPALMERHGVLLSWLNHTILTIFIIELLLKLAANGRQPWKYLTDGWNVFDFLIVLLCLVPIGGPFAAVLRLTRVLRLLRLVSALPKLQLLVGALLKSLSAMGYVSLLLGLLFYIYAVAGIQFFGQTDPAHFGSLGRTFLTLFQLVTLDNWADIFNAQAAHVSAIKVALYFVSFIVFGTMIILNLFIGIIMNSMAEAHAEQASEILERKSPHRDLDRRLNEAIQQVDALQGALTDLRRHIVKDRLSTPPATNR